MPEYKYRVDRMIPVSMFPGAGLFDVTGGCQKQKSDVNAAYENRRAKASAMP